MARGGLRRFPQEICYFGRYARAEAGVALLSWQGGHIWPICLHVANPTGASMKLSNQIPWRSRTAVHRGPLGEGSLSSRWPQGPVAHFGEADRPSGMFGRCRVL